MDFFSQKISDQVHSLEADIESLQEDLDRADSSDAFTFRIKQRILDATEQLDRNRKLLAEFSHPSKVAKTF